MIYLCTALILGIIIAVVLVALLIPSKAARSTTNSNLATAAIMGIGTYYIGQTLAQAFDENSTTKYTSFGSCVNTSTLECGQNTGVYLTLNKGVSLLVYLRFCAANSLPARDPLTMTVEGSNQPPSALTFGSNCTLIYNGSTGLDRDPDRLNYGETIIIQNSAIWYLSYRILITSKRDIHTAVQYSEVKLFGY